MKVIVDFDVAPPLQAWQDVMTPDGWKITKYTSDHLRAKKDFGQSRFPVRNATTWYVTIDEHSENGATVEMEVPAFASNDYAEYRMRGKIADLADCVDGDYETDDDLSIDVLARLRDNKNGE